MRRFFTHVQAKNYRVGNPPARRVLLSFNPSEAFRAPQNIACLLAPNPRDIDPVIWARLTWAAALLWVTAARRRDEIRRLSVGCVKKNWSPEMTDEYGLALRDEDDLVYLMAPRNKTSRAFYIPIPRYTANAINEWLKERGKFQRARIDRKDKQPTAYLFMYANRVMGGDFINHRVIPVLCTKAGVPPDDARGKITSHRARATIATFLREEGA